MITVQDIRKSFDGSTVLKGISFDVRDGETLVVLGKSGCGKSILLKMIIGLMKPDSGSIVVDGGDVVSMSYGQLRQVRLKFGFLFQGAALFDSLTVGENIALALRRGNHYEAQEVRDRVRSSLDLVGLGAVERAMPSGLSGGMKKRVGLARAIASSPQYVLFDEPTTGLDLATADGISLLINDLRSKLGVTSIVVTHDIHSAFIVGDRFAILDGGVTLMTGTREEIEGSRDEHVRKYITSSISISGATSP
jgi:phospholipid/cholesterol/gamma-HCH transport system ATP-binding protein